MSRAGEGVVGSSRFGFGDLAGRGELGVEGEGHGGSQDLFPTESLTLARVVLHPRVPSDWFSPGSSDWKLPPVSSVSPSCPLAGGAQISGVGRPETERQVGNR